MSLLLKARAACVCNQLYSCNVIVDETELDALRADPAVVLNTSRRTALLKVMDAALEHSKNHERVAMMLTLNMEEGDLFAPPSKAAR